MSDESDKKTGRKIIQKKIKKRERYARMARLRYRKEKNIPTAQYTFVKRPSKYSNPSHIKLLPLGLFYAHSFQNMTTDISLLNYIKISPSTEISQNDPDVVKINMHTDFTYSGLLIEENQTQEKIHKVEGSEIWTYQVENFSRAFLKFKANAMYYDERDKKQELLAKERLNSFTDLRANLFSNNPCIELRSKLNYEEFHVSEMYFNNSILNELGHSQETFNNVILKEGFPEISVPGSESLIHAISKCVEGFDFSMDSPKKITNLKTTLILRSLLLKEAHYDLFIASYHRKKSPEVSFIIVFNDFKLSLNRYTPRAFSSDFAERIETLDLNKSDFLKKFYPVESKAFFKAEPKTCLIKELPISEPEFIIETAKDIKPVVKTSTTSLSTQIEELKSESPKLFAPVILQTQKQTVPKGQLVCEEEERRGLSGKGLDEISFFKTERLGESKDYSSFSKQGFRKVKDSSESKKHYESEEDKHIAELEHKIWNEYVASENLKEMEFTKNEVESPAECRTRTNSAAEDFENPDLLNLREHVPEELTSTKSKDVKGHEPKWTSKTEKPVFGQAAQVQN